MKRNITVIIILVAVAVLAFLVGQGTRTEQPMTEKPKEEPKVELKYPGAEKHEVSLAEAKQYIQNYQKSQQLHKPKKSSIKGVAFAKGAVEKILSQPGCAHLRIYYGVNKERIQNLVLVGVDTAGKDMTNLCMLERGTLCPPFCDMQSLLLQIK
jgi:hypothetical protein